MKEKIQTALLTKFPEDIKRKGEEIYLRNEIIKIENGDKSCTVSFIKDTFVINKDWLIGDTLYFFIKKQILLLSIFDMIYKIDKKAFIYSYEAGLIDIFFGNFYFHLNLETAFRYLNKNKDVYFSVSVLLFNFRKQMEVRFEFDGEEEESCARLMNELSRFFKKKRLECLFEIDRLNESPYYWIKSAFKIHLTERYTLENITEEELREGFYRELKKKNTNTLPFVTKEDIDQMKWLDISKTNEGDVLLKKAECAHV